MLPKESFKIESEIHKSSVCIESELSARLKADLTLHVRFLCVPNKVRDLRPVLLDMCVLCACQLGNETCSQP